MAFWKISLLPISLLVITSSAQECYYPNGDAVSAEPVAPCYSWGGPCCPQSWTCLSNNLCHLENESLNLTGRYSCADKDWGSSCPEFCRTENNGEIGNQAVQDCGGGEYCCNAQGLDTDKCCETGAPRFTPGSGTPVSTILTVDSSRQLSGATPSASDSSAGSLTAGESSTEASSTESTTAALTTKQQQPTTPASTTTQAASSSNVQTTAQTHTTMSVISSAGAPPSTVQVIVVSTALVTAPPSSTAGSKQDHSGNGLAIGVGLGVGIPIAIAIIAATWFFMRRRQKANQKERIHSFSASISKDGKGIMTPDTPSPVFAKTASEGAWGGGGFGAQLSPHSPHSPHSPIVAELDAGPVIQMHQLHEEPRPVELSQASEVPRPVELGTDSGHR